MLLHSVRNRRPALQSLPDEELMARVGERDGAAFEIVFDRYGGPAFSLAYRMCGQRSLAEEVVQETFMSLWRDSRRYDHARGSLRGWILTLVRNRAIDMFRSRGARERQDMPDDGLTERLLAAEETDLEAARREEADQVREALQTLPDEQRQVIELAFFGGFTHMQIAEQLELAPGTVKGRMRLGLTKLRHSLGGLAGSVV